MRFPSTPSAPSDLEAAIKLATPFFGSSAALGTIAAVGVDDLPSEARSLLAHSGHMTESLERHHGCPVSVRVRGEVRGDEVYARHSLLARQSDGAVVQSGVLRIRLAELPMAMAASILDGKVPLGRVLIDGNLLRRVELIALWRIAAGPTLADELAVDRETVIYGRSARILVEGSPAVELLEIVKT